MNFLRKIFQAIWKTPNNQVINEINIPKKDTNLVICSACKNDASYLNKNIQVLNKYQWVISRSDFLTFPNEVDQISFYETWPMTKMEKLKHQVSVKTKEIEYGENLKSAINVAVYRYNPRFILILQPEFFIFSNLEDIMNKMRETNLAVWGAPYANISPKEMDRIRDVPTPLCMLIDLNKFDVSHINVSPEYYKYGLYPGVGYKMCSLIKEKYEFELMLPVVYDECNYKSTSEGIRELFGAFEITSFDLKTDEYIYNNTLGGVHLLNKITRNKKKLNWTKEQRINNHLNLIDELYLKYPTWKN